MDAVGGESIATGELPSNGIFGSLSGIAAASLLESDTRAAEPNGGRTLPCPRGLSYPTKAPCESVGTIKDLDFLIALMTYLIVQIFLEDINLDIILFKLQEKDKIVVMVVMVDLVPLVDRVEEMVMVEEEDQDILMVQLLFQIF